MPLYEHNKLRTVVYQRRTCTWQLHGNTTLQYSRKWNAAI